MRINKLGRFGASFSNHVTVEGKSGDVIGVGGVGGDHGGVEEDIGGAEVVEDMPSVIEVAEVDCAEADEFECE